MPCVLIVDDRADMRELVAMYVEDQGCEFVKAESGVEAIGWLRQRRFDLVLLDYHMPPMSGIDVLRALCDDSSIPRPPIVMLSADTGSRIDAMRLGASDFVTKTQWDHLSRVIAKFIALTSRDDEQ